MKRKKILKLLLFSLLSTVLLVIAYVSFRYYYTYGKYPTNKDKYPEYIGYIDISKAALNKTYKLCDSTIIIGKHHGMPKHAYHISKKQFRKNILNAYQNHNYTDSGYLNFRFIVNCEGKAGWFETVEMNLDLIETDLNDAMVNQLLTLTANEKHWAVFTHENKSYDYYMYISYRIEHGEIIEILP